MPPKKKSAAHSLQQLNAQRQQDLLELLLSERLSTPEDIAELGRILLEENSDQVLQPFIQEKKLGYLIHFISRNSSEETLCRLLTKKYAHTPAALTLFEAVLLHGSEDELILFFNCFNTAPQNLRLLENLAIRFDKEQLENLLCRYQQLKELQHTCPAASDYFSTLERCPGLIQLLQANLTILQHLPENLIPEDLLSAVVRHARLDRSPYIPEVFLKRLAERRPRPSHTQKIFFQRCKRRFRTEILPQHSQIENVQFELERPCPPWFMDVAVIITLPTNSKIILDFEVDNPALHDSKKDEKRDAWLISSRNAHRVLRWKIHENQQAFFETAFSEIASLLAESPAPGEVIEFEPRSDVTEVPSLFDSLIALRQSDAADPILEKTLLTLYAATLEQNSDELFEYLEYYNPPGSELLQATCIKHIFSSEQALSSEEKITLSLRAYSLLAQSTTNAWEYDVTRVNTSMKFFLREIEEHYETARQEAENFESTLREAFGLIDMTPLTAEEFLMAIIQEEVLSPTQNTYAATLYGLFNEETRKTIEATIETDSLRATIQIAINDKLKSLTFCNLVHAVGILYSNLMLQSLADHYGLRLLQENHQYFFQKRNEKYQLQFDADNKPNLQKIMAPTPPSTDSESDPDSPENEGTSSASPKRFALKSPQKRITLSAVKKQISSPDSRERISQKDIEAAIQEIQNELNALEAEKARKSQALETQKKETDEEISEIEREIRDLTTNHLRGFKEEIAARRSKKLDLNDRYKKLENEMKTIEVKITELQNILPQPDSHSLSPAFIARLKAKTKLPSPKKAPRGPLFASPAPKKRDVMKIIKTVENQYQKLTAKSQHELFTLLENFFHTKKAVFIIKNGKKPTSFKVDLSTPQKTENHPESLRLIRTLTKKLLLNLATQTLSYDFYGFLLRHLEEILLFLETPKNQRNIKYLAKIILLKLDIKDHYPSVTAPIMLLYYLIATEPARLSKLFADRNSSPQIITLNQFDSLRNFARILLQHPESMEAVDGFFQNTTLQEDLIYLAAALMGGTLSSPKNPEETFSMSVFYLDFDLLFKFATHVENLKNFDNFFITLITKFDHPISYVLPPDGSFLEMLIEHHHLALVEIYKRKTPKETFLERFLASCLTEIEPTNHLVLIRIAENHKSEFRLIFEKKYIDFQESQILLLVESFFEYNDESDIPNTRNLEKMLKAPSEFTILLERIADGPAEEAEEFFATLQKACKLLKETDYPFLTEIKHNPRWHGSLPQENAPPPRSSKMGHFGTSDSQGPSTSNSPAP